MSHPIRGFITGLRSDSAIQTEVILGPISIYLLYTIFGPFSHAGTLLLYFCFFALLSLEFVNSAIETLLDKLHPEYDKLVKISKDYSSAAVLIMGVFALISAYFVVTGKI